MTWEECDLKLARYDPIKWPKDGDKRRLIVLDEPEFITFDFRGQKRKRARCLVYHSGDVLCWFLSGTLYSDLRKLKDKLATHALEVVRHGKPKSMDTTYALATKPMTAAERKFAAEFAESAEAPADDSDLPF